MALIRDYELPGTGLTAENAYHVVTNVAVEKRTHDINGPKDSSRPDGFTEGHKEPGKEIDWKAGYVGTISITVWKDAAARESGANPLGYLGINPSDNKYGANLTGNPGNHVVKFFIDNDSSDNYVTQAYKHLKTTEYYSGCAEV